MAEVVRTMALDSEDPVIGDDLLLRRTLRACTEVHRRLGPGFAARTYRDALCAELGHSGLAYRRKLAVPVFYRGIRLDATYDVDVVVDGALPILTRTLAAVAAVHRAELRALLRALGLDRGLLVNFATPRLRDGVVLIRRVPSGHAPGKSDLDDAPTVIRPPSNREVA